MNVSARSGGPLAANIGKQNCCLSPLGCAHRSLSTSPQSRQPQLMAEAVQNGAISSQKAMGLQAIQKQEEIRKELLQRDVFETTTLKAKEAQKEAPWTQPVQQAAQAQQLLMLRLRDPMAV